MLAVTIVQVFPYILLAPSWNTLKNRVPFAQWSI